MVRVSKTQLRDLEDYAFANELNVAQVARRAIHQFLLTDDAHALPEMSMRTSERVERERFEEAP